MELIFLGTGSAFSAENNQSNMLLESRTRTAAAGGGNGVARLMIDCGMTVPQALRNQNVDMHSVQSLYLSHQHADHVGGLEWFGLSRFFANRVTGLALPNLYISRNLAASLWNETLQGGMKSIQGTDLTLADYFGLNLLDDSGTFQWEDLSLTLVPTIHLTSPLRTMMSRGLMMQNPAGRRAYLTADTQFCPGQMMNDYQRADVIFQDCETSDWQGTRKSGAHAHYNELKTLPAAIKQKMWLYHYNDGALPDAKADGFAGFVKQGQRFDLREI